MLKSNYLNDIQKKLNGKRVCIFPMGIAGTSMSDKLRTIGIEVSFFCDNSPQSWGKCYKGKECLRPEILAQMPQDELAVVIESAKYYDEIKRQLLDAGIKNVMRIFFEKISAEKYTSENMEAFLDKAEDVKNICADQRSIDVYEYLLSSWQEDSIADDYFKKVCDKNQYFAEGVIHLKEDEVFVDLGAYTGDTARSFLEESRGKYEKIHLFELDPFIYRQLMKNAASMQEEGTGLIQCYPYGISDQHGTISFVSGDSNSSILDSSDNADADAGEIRTLDELLGGEKVTFIKMDIEGAELSALRGVKTIQAQKPTLAVCIYHSPDDMLEIPLFIKKLVPEYKIYIRHYTDEMLETVCYAVIED